MTRKPLSPADTALSDAAASGDTAAARAALAAGARTEARDERGRTPLLRAALADHVEVARLLVASGADVDAQDGRRDSPWLVTGVTGSVAMMRALLPGDPDVTLTNRYGGVSVIPASERGHVGYVRAVLAETGIAVDHVNRLGWTALLEAVILGDGGRDHQEVVRILLAAGADPFLPDGHGVTALAHARRLGFTALADLLRAAEEAGAGPAAGSTR
ncbi:ankyrin repeat domain-containing protein [Streptomyces sp. NPDC097619]|uniref:ankyrin repeat domain-containing protein n=1 Tax=Streptomyces sp. NPDC097619 TaxID=3157228 RepID=UPI00331ADE8A